MKIIYNNKEYEAVYNKQTGYYEIELAAPNTGGIYNIDAEFTDILNQTTKERKEIQVLAKEKNKIKSNITLMWIFDSVNFKIKDIIELSDYEITIDEETNANTTVDVLKKTKAQADDIVVIKNG